MTNSAPLPRVLIVDDHPLVRRACQQALSVVAVVETASGGLEALDCLALSAFDIVVLDLQMPVLDGLATLDEIRLRFPEMSGRVVVMTGGPSLVEELRMQERGVAWIQKPLRLDALRELVAQATAQSVSTDAT